MAETRERYRRLPGRRRGFLRGSSVWMGSDHLLLVKSMRFREEYKRFHLRDIQAIVVAERPRFHISTRAVAIGLLWLIAYGLFLRITPSAGLVLWPAALGLIAAWLYISAAASCICRIYTAVSSDDLPSVYRTWTARRFLAAVEPRIYEAQGGGEVNWAEAAETAVIGPPVSAEGIGRQTSATVAGPAARPRTWVSDLFVASLFADVLLNVWRLSHAPPAFDYPGYSLAIGEIVCAVAVLVQHHRGLLQSAMQKLAILTLGLMGVLYYIRPIIAAFTNTRRAVTVELQPMGTPLRYIDIAVTLALALTGAWLSWRGEERPTTLDGGTA